MAKNMVFGLWYLKLSSLPATQSKPSCPLGWNGVMPSPGSVVKFVVICRKRKLLRTLAGNTQGNIPNGPKQLYRTYIGQKTGTLELL